MGDLDRAAGGSNRDGVDVELLAASLRASSRDVASFVEVLASKLEQALPGRVRVARRGRRFLSAEKPVASLECELGQERYLLATRDGMVETRRATAVRGIVLKTEEVPLEDWIEALARSLAVEASTSERARVTLEQLLAGS